MLQRMMVLRRSLAAGVCKGQRALACSRCAAVVPEQHAA
jgi:hypothetical protein